ncbi:hypothetical protein EEB13_05645 [Rhodococcus sp. WS3]|nr:hypothetical protein EEB13_05645 [Rhodococcus sp. WS3]
MTPPHPLDRDLLADLNEQFLFLKNSCATYDGGFEAEAKRIAVVIRTLVHDTKNSRSLLYQMKIKSVLQWNDTAHDIKPHNIAATTGLTSMGLGLDGSIAFLPRVGERLRSAPSLRTVSFDDWWTRHVIKDANGNLFSRRDLVLALANKDGGAHIDRLQASTFALAHENSTGWIRMSDSGATNPMPSPIFPSVRTIAEELGTTIADQQQLIVDAWSARD